MTGAGYFDGASGVSRSRYLAPCAVAVRQRIGYLAQDPRYYQHMTAREAMRFSARFFYNGPQDAVEARIEETLALVGLEGKEDRPIKGFSSGERQRGGTLTLMLGTVFDGRGPIVALWRFNREEF